MAVSDFYTAQWPDFICISAHYKYHAIMVCLMMIMMMIVSSIILQCNKRHAISGFWNGQFISRFN